MNRILLVDDDLELCDLLTEYFASEGLETEVVNDGCAGADRALTGDYALVVLDVMLPGMNGFDALRKIREHSKVPVIMLTARGDDVDRIVGLEMGADDYLPKPFNPRELIARIRAIQRRSRDDGGLFALSALTDPLVQEDLILKRGSREVLRDNLSVSLTSVEFALLDILLSRAGQPVPREDLVREALGRDLSPYDRSIDVHISALRKKLGPSAAGSERIKTVRGVGYQYLIGQPL
ncbi:MAG: DNA-binding response regulator [Desulfuromonas sp.]|nr:MAG: DNA-binding response regulator [Desulfuromonas sp.]